MDNNILDNYFFIQIISLLRKIERKKTHHKNMKEIKLSTTTKDGATFKF
jgi:hypothetical protein